MGCECRSPSQLYGVLYIQVVPVFLEVARTRRKLFLTRAFITLQETQVCSSSVNAVKLLKVSLGRCTPLCRIFMLPFSMNDYPCVRVLIWLIRCFLKVFRTTSVRRPLLPINRAIIVGDHKRTKFCLDDVSRNVSNWDEEKHDVVDKERCQSFVRE